MSDVEHAALLHFLDGGRGVSGRLPVSVKGPPSWADHRLRFRAEQFPKTRIASSPAGPHFCRDTPEVIRCLVPFPKGRSGGEASNLRSGCVSEGRELTQPGCAPVPTLTRLCLRPSSMSCTDWRPGRGLRQGLVRNKRGAPGAGRGCTLRLRNGPCSGRWPHGPRSPGAPPSWYAETLRRSSPIT